MERGEIKFSLNGEKLRGSFVIVKLKNSQKGNEWLMIKHKDTAVDPNWNIDEHDGSVLTGRVLEEIKAEEAAEARAKSIARRGTGRREEERDAGANGDRCWQRFRSGLSRIPIGCSKLNGMACARWRGSKTAS